MKSPLHILHLEDDPNDAALVQATLEAEGITCATTCVRNRDGFVAALEHGGIDLILSDFTLLAFDGVSAAEIVRTQWPAIPLILVSGALGEERAIDSLKSGATDYVLKERLARLAPAVRRAMQEVEERAERRRLEAQFIEAQKMEVVGQLAGGVAHDFNNLLTVISGYCELLRDDLESGSRQQTDLGEIQRAAERAAELTRQLLAFSRRQILEPRVLSLSDSLKTMEPMLKRLIGEHIDVVVRTPPEIGHVRADPGQIEQVILNLAINARDAMPDGGTLLLELKDVELDVSYTRQHVDAVPGPHVMLAVSDTGSGMDAATAARVFEPFFTTKPTGQGTGLGLSTVHGIVKQTGGIIGVYSEPGRGTIFKVYLPRVDAPIDVTPASPAAETCDGSETILLLEDEEAVRALAERVLVQRGYRVLAAATPGEALDLAAGCKDGLHLLLSDVVLPGMSGTALADKLLADHPGLCVLYMSGYTDDAIVQNGMLGRDRPFIQKPFTPEALLRKVRWLLDRRD